MRSEHWTNESSEKLAFSVKEHGHKKLSNSRRLLHPNTRIKIDTEFDPEIDTQYPTHPSCWRLHENVDSGETQGVFGE